MEVKDIDLSTSYVKYFKPKPRMSQKTESIPKIWGRHGAAEPLNDWAKLPKGWTDQEPDLDPG